jgi:predicted Zn finger-like uncharacterized protein
MPIYCPQCATASDIRAAVGSSGRMARCKACGTTWLARVIDEDPYQRKPPAVAGQSEVSDAVVIEHIGAGFKPERPRPRPRSRARSRFASLIGSDRGALKILAAGLAVVVAVAVLRIPFVVALPNLTTASLPQGADKLEFQKVHSQTVERRGLSALLVEGEIVNRSDRDVALPAVRISLRSSNGAEVQSWLMEPSVDGLAAGHSIGFRSAMASPSPAATQVTLKLAAREGRTIGLH